MTTTIVEINNINNLNNDLNKVGVLLRRGIILRSSSRDITLLLRRGVITVLLLEPMVVIPGMVRPLLHKS
jgi:hypothetical protein